MKTPCILLAFIFFVARYPSSVGRSPRNFCTMMGRVFPTEVSHFDVVVGLCSDDPKDFYNLR